MSQEVPDPLLESALDGLSDGVALVAQDGSLLFLNTSAEDMTGWTRDQARGKPAGEVLNSDPPLPLGPLNPTETPVFPEDPQETTLSSRDGWTTLVEARGSLLAPRLLASPVLQITLTDISTRKMASELRMEAVEHYRQLFGQNRATMLLIDPRSLMVVDANEAAAAFYGRSLDQLRGLDMSELSQYSPEQMKERFQNTLQKGGGRYDTSHRMANGEARDVEVLITPIVLKGQHLVYVIVIDLTARKRAEKKLLQRMAIEKMAARISTRFLRDVRSNVDEMIEQALQELGEFAGIDRCYLCVLAPNKSRTRKIYGWHSPQVRSLRNFFQKMDWSRMGWTLSRLRNLEVLHFPNFSEIPPEGDSDRREWERLGFKSLLVIPLLLEGEMRGFLGFNSELQEKRWDPEDITLLGMVGEILAGALERQAAVEKIQEAQSALEVKVRERTAALREANRALQVEVERHKQTVHQLENSLSMLHATMESNADGIVVYDRNNRPEIYNSRYLEVFGYTREGMESETYEARIRHVLTLVKHPREHWERLRYINSRPDIMVTDIVEFKNGRIIERFTTPRIVEGQSSGRVWSFRDITDRRRAEENLQIQYNLAIALSAIVEQQETLNLVFDTLFKVEGISMAALFLADGPGTSQTRLIHERGLPPRKEDAGPVYLELPPLPSPSYGTGEELLKGSPAFPDPSFKATARIPVRYQDRVEGELVIASRHLSEFASPNRVLAESIASEVGRVLSRVWAEAELERNREALEALNSQLVSLNQALREEIQGHRRTEDELRISLSLLYESEKRFLDVAANSGDWIWEIDRMGRFTYCSFTVETILGYRPLELSGRNALDFVPQELRNSVRRAFVRELRHAGVIRFLKTQMQHKEGHRVYIETSAVPVRNESGDVSGFRGVHRDITEQRMAQERARRQEQQLIQADKMISLGTLVSGVAHEINNPNNFVLLNSRIFGQAWEDIAPILDSHFQESGDFTLAGLPYSRARAKLQEMVKGLHEGAQRIQRIVQDLKDFARQDSAGMDEEVDLNAVVNSAITLVSNLIRKSTKSFTAELAETLPPVRGNHQRLEQIVINLLQNSCQALPDNSRSIRVRTFYIPSERKVEVEVSDEGKGIPPEHLQQVFDPFFTTKRDIGGTGLGLPISARIAHDHGGKLEFRSRVGEGTKALLHLPAITSD